MARPSFRSEILTVLFFSVTLAAVDNSFVSVFVKQTFSGVAPDRLLNFVVALCGSASEIANILSFIWASASLGRPKVPFINALQLGVIILVASTALVPKTTAGLLVLAALVLAARVCWSGIILLRPGVWRANYRKDRAHVVRFRAIHSWAFVLAQLLFLLAIATNQPALLIAGSVMLAVGFGGGTLAWNLGHVDFSPPAETSQYMATHVTLNGVRGLIAPLFAVALFEKLRAWDLSVQQAASWVLALGLLIAVAGSIGFVLLKRSMGSTAGMTHRSQNR